MGSTCDRLSVLRVVLPSLQARRAETMADGLPRACRSCRIMGEMFAESKCGSRFVGRKKIGPYQNHFFGRFSKIVGNYKVLASRTGLFGSVLVFGWLAKLVCESSLSLAVLVVISVVDFLVFRCCYGHCIWYYCDVSASFW